MNLSLVCVRRASLACRVFGSAFWLGIGMTCAGLAQAQQPAQAPAAARELTRTIRTWEFLPVVGTRAGLFGNEAGRFEAWVYPLKIFRDFHLTFHVAIALSRRKVWHAS